MDRINGIVTFNINFYLNLEDSMFDNCEKVSDVLEVLKNKGLAFEEIADEREVQRILYEGFEVEVNNIDEW